MDCQVSCYHYCLSLFSACLCNCCSVLLFSLVRFSVHCLVYIVVCVALLFIVLRNGRITVRVEFSLHMRCALARGAGCLLKQITFFFPTGLCVQDVPSHVFFFYETAQALENFLCP